MPRTKELHYFDYHIKRRPHLLRLAGIGRRTEHHLRYGLRFLPGNLSNQKTGEITPAYSTLAITKVRRIRDFIPDLRIILLLRDPIERAWSHAKKDFEGLYGKGLGTATDRELEEFFHLPFVKVRGDYAHTISNWFSVFPSDQIYVGYTEKVTTEPRSELQEIFEFVGVEPEPDLNWDRIARPVHTSEKVPIPERWRDRLGRKLSEQVKAVRDQLNEEPPWPQEAYHLTEGVTE